MAMLPFSTSQTFSAIIFVSNHHPCSEPSSGLCITLLSNSCCLVLKLSSEPKAWFIIRCFLFGARLKGKFWRIQFSFPHCLVTVVDQTLLLCYLVEATSGQLPHVAQGVECSGSTSLACFSLKRSIDFKVQKFIQVLNFLDVLRKVVKIRLTCVMRNITAYLNFQCSRS